MPGDIQTRFPGDLQLPTRWFGLLTTRDLARLVGPPLLVGAMVFPPTTWAALGALLGGVGLGVTLLTLRLYGLPMDQVVARLIAWVTTRHRVRIGELRTRHHRAVETREGTVVGILKVPAVAVQLRSQAEQRALQQIWQDVFDTITYPVEIQSRQRRLSLDTYIDQIAAVDAQEDVTADAARLRAAYTAYCRRLNSGDLVVTDHYVVVRVKTDTAATVTGGLRSWLKRLWYYNLSAIPAALTGSERPDVDESCVGTSPTETAIEEVDRRCTDLRQVISRGDLTATRLTGPALQDAIDQLYTGTIDCTPTTATVTDTPATDRSRYQQHLVITDYPQHLPFGWVDTLHAVDGLVDVTQVIQPRDTAEVVQYLRRRLTQLEAEIGAQQAAGHAGTNEYEARAADANRVLDLLAAREATACDYGLLITVRGPTASQCQQTLETVQTRLDTLQVAYDVPYFRTPQMVRTHSPFQHSPIPTVLLPSTSAAAGFPATTASTIGRQGVVYGEQPDGTPVILDRFQWSSHSLVRMGMVGSGKSYATKLELLRAWLATPDPQIYVIDPKQEYTGLVQALGGTTHTVDSESSVDPGLFDASLVAVAVADRGADNTAVLRELVRTLYTATSQDRTRTLVIIDEARILLNDSQGRDLLNQFVLEARDTQTAITLITQNASHFTQHRQGREILDNTPAKMFMRHERVPESVVTYFQLSERERHALYTLQTGTDSVCSDALLKVPEQGVDTRLRVRATAPEHQVISLAETASPTDDDPERNQHGEGDTS